MISKETSRILGGSLMIGGTAIGAGMLGLPIKNGPTGFPLATASLFLVYLFMLASIFLYFENILYMSDKSANLISMTKARLSKPLQYFTWLAYALIHFCAIWAYIAGGGDIISSFLQSAFHISISETKCSLLFAVVLGSLVFTHIHVIDMINRVFMIGLFASFILLFTNITPMVSLEYLTAVDVNHYLLIGIPIAAASYTSHIVLPSLRDYFDNDIKSLNKAIIIGAFLPFLFYIIWEFLILGMVPTSGANSISSIAQHAKPLGELLKVIGQSPYTNLLLVSFQLFALVTSFFGLALSRRDFFRDGLKLDNSLRSRSIASLIVLLPPLVLALTFPDGFKKAIDYIGSFAMICFVVVPVIMAWKARYIDYVETEVKLPGGKPALIIMGIIGTAIMVIGLFYAGS